MKLLIWGAGAIGGTLGAYLARAGHDVTLVDTVAEHVAAINARGCASPDRSPSSPRTRPPSRRRRCAGEWDTIILATKAQHTDAAARAFCRTWRRTAASSRRRTA